MTKRKPKKKYEYRIHKKLDTRFKTKKEAIEYLKHLAPYKVLVGYKIKKVKSKSKKRKK